MLSDSQLALLCVHSYLDFDILEDFSLEHGPVNIHVDKAVTYRPARDVEAIMYSVNKYDILCTRGTEVFGNWNNAWDIARDLYFLPYKTEWGYVHKGFGIGAERIIDNIDFNLDRPLLLAGHSLGAGITQCLALYLYPFIDKVVMFGAPGGLFRSARDSYHARDINKITTSYCHHFDWIRWLPPLWGFTAVNRTFCGWKVHSILSYVKSVYTLNG